MAKKIAWKWDKIDWDARFRGLDPKYPGVHINPRDIEFMNCSEITEILNLRGIRAHRGMDHGVLSDLLLHGQSIDPPANPVDVLRDRLIEYIKAHLRQVRPQLEPDCVAVKSDCYAHPDAVVIDCYKANFEKRGGFSE
jgi:hypothetical protein